MTVRAWLRGQRPARTNPNPASRLWRDRLYEALLGVLGPPPARRGREAELQARVEAFDDPEIAWETLASEVGLGDWVGGEEVFFYAERGYWLSPRSVHDVVAVTSDPAGLQRAIELALLIGRIEREVALESGHLRAAALPPRHVSIQNAPARDGWPFQKSLLSLYRTADPTEPLTRLTNQVLEDRPRGARRKLEFVTTPRADLYDTWMDEPTRVAVANVARAGVWWEAHRDASANPFAALLDLWTLGYGYLGIEPIAIRNQYMTQPRLLVPPLHDEKD